MFNPFKKKTHLKITDSIACFGKLPCHFEFIKYQLTTPQAIELDHWYQSAYSELHQEFGLDSKELLKHMPTYHFLFCGAKPMIGSVYASHDLSGRHYPFVITRILDNSLSQEFITSVPLLYIDYFEATEKFFQQAAFGSKLNNIEPHLQQLLEIPYNFKKRIALEQVLTTLKTTSINDYWQLIREQTAKIDIDTFFLQLTQRFKQSRPLGVRLPLPNHMNPLPFVTFYLQLFEILLPAANLNWQAYWQQSNDLQNAHMLFTHQPLNSNCWKYFLTKDHSIQNIYDSFTATQNCDQIALFNKSNTSLYDALQGWDQTPIY